jgi:hypothetical protein
MATYGRYRRGNKRKMPQNVYTDGQRIELQLWRWRNRQSTEPFNLIDFDGYNLIDADGYNLTVRR